MILSLINWLQLLALPVAGVGAGLFWYGTQVEPKRYQLESIDVTVSGGAQSLEKIGVIRILHISDLHLCYPDSRKIEFLKKITNDDYDFVFLTGDIFQNPSALLYAKSILSRIPKFGAYAVLGNHDYHNYSMINKTFGRIVRRFRHPDKKRNVEPVIDALRRGNFTVMRNEAIELKDQGIQIVGIDYPGIDADHLKQLIDSCPTDALRLVLFHMPINLGVIGGTGTHLAFGGHTHGGQIRIPGFGAVITDSELPTAQASGLVKRGDTIFHISRGLGADPRSNIRLFCSPAATIINVTCS